jgi:hypothetical protein
LGDGERGVISSWTEYDVVRSDRYKASNSALSFSHLTCYSSTMSIARSLTAVHSGRVVSALAARKYSVAAGEPVRTAPPPPPPPPPSSGTNWPLLLGALAVAGGGAYYYTTRPDEAKAKGREVKTKAQEAEAAAKARGSELKHEAEAKYLDIKVRCASRFHCAG